MAKYHYKKKEIKKLKKENTALEQISNGIRKNLQLSQTIIQDKNQTINAHQSWKEEATGEVKRAADHIEQLKAEVASLKTRSEALEKEQQQIKVRAKAETDRIASEMKELKTENEVLKR